MRNRRFVRRLDTTLRKIENPRTVMREPVKKTPLAKRDMYERLHQSAMMMHEQGIVLYKKVDIERVVNYKDIMMLLTRIKEYLMLKTMPQLLSTMVMVGVMSQLRRNMKYVLMMHNEGDRSDQGGLLNLTQNTTQKCLT